MTPDERAEMAAAAMWANDKASSWLGLSIVSMHEGRAELSLVVEPHHLNGHGICHGGVVFALADSAFAFACNSRNQATVAQHNMISFVVPAHEGDALTAIAEEVSLNGRNGIYDVSVTNQTGQIVAEMRGLSRTISGQLFKEAS